MRTCTNPDMVDFRLIFYGVHGNSVRLHRKWTEDISVGAPRGEIRSSFLLNTGKKINKTGKK